MLHCRACLWRCIRAVDATVPPNPHVAAALPYGRRRVAMRRYSDGPVHENADRPDSSDRLEKRSKSKKEYIAGVKKKERKSLTRRPAPPAETKSTEGKSAALPVPRGHRDPSIPVEDWNKRRRELQYLADPLELATFVKQELGKNRHEEMLQLVRMASRTMQCVVSWNHIIDYTLAQGRTSQALKIYNEMKKRAQFPDAYTYSILLKGLSENAHESGALGKALALFHSMDAENARVQPSIVHANAMLRVCARSLDMDALWGVAAKIPDKGPGSANARTFATILNAIRQSLLVNVPTGETEEEVAVRRERGIMEGRRVWEEIIGKWKNADLVIDDDLVCAMGRLLLIGPRPRDWDDVLSLIEQTMDIPRLVPRLGSVERKKAGFPHLRGPNVPKQFKFDDDHLAPGGAPTRGDEFLPIAPQGVKGLTNSLTYVTPTNNTLSLLMEACQKIVAKNVSDHYWNMLTDPSTYHVVPDINNVNMRLRNLRQNRASKEATKMLTDYFAEKGAAPPPGTFRIAISTCARDMNNHNSLKHAGQILDMMMKAREDADAKVVTKYCEVAISFPLKTGADLVDALARLAPVTKNLRLQLGVGTSRFEGRRPYLVGEHREDAISAIRKIYAVHDKLINSDLISEEEKKPYKAEKATLSAYLHRLSFKDGGGGAEPGSLKWEAVKAEYNKDAAEEGGEESEAGEKNEFSIRRRAKVERGEFYKNAFPRNEVFKREGPKKYKKEDSKKYKRKGKPSKFMKKPLFPRRERVEGEGGRGSERKETKDPWHAALDE